MNWRKARRSVNNGACVEVASPFSDVLVRDSKSPDLVIDFTPDAWQAFIRGLCDH